MEIRIVPVWSTHHLPDWPSDLPVPPGPPEALLWFLLALRWSRPSHLRADCVGNGLPPETLSHGERCFLMEAARYACLVLAHRSSPGNLFRVQILPACQWPPPREGDTRPRGITSTQDSIITTDYWEESFKARGDGRRRGAAGLNPQPAGALRPGPSARGRRPQTLQHQPQKATREHSTWEQPQEINTWTRHWVMEEKGKPAWLRSFIDI